MVGNIIRTNYIIHNLSFFAPSQKDVQVNLPMTIMGVFGIVGAFALFMFRDKR